MVIAYEIARLEDGTVRAWKYAEGAEPVALAHVALHSPTGFEIGYGGSGPADLALSLLADAIGAPTQTAAYSGIQLYQSASARRAAHRHPRYKREILASRTVEPGGSVMLNGEGVLIWLAYREVEAIAELAVDTMRGWSNDEARRAFELGKLIGTLPAGAHARDRDTPGLGLQILASARTDVLGMYRQAIARVEDPYARLALVRRLEPLGAATVDPIGDGITYHELAP